MPTEYRICSRCIMDTSDPNITFDENGWCNHCRIYVQMAPKYLSPDADRQEQLERLIAKIKTKGRGKEYDCIIGVSGGGDSTYTAYVVKKLGLRPLAVHMDNGWNTELSEHNVEKLVERLNLDILTHEVDWEQFKDLQLAFLKASVPDAEIPTDHAIWALLYQAAAKKSIPYVILGTNFATEAIVPPAWTYGVMDWHYIKSVHRKFGTIRLQSFPHLSFAALHLCHPFFSRIQCISILNYVTYEKQEAMKIIGEELGWKPYGGKHYESVYTRFIQGYVLPRKFNIDKRIAHQSALIMGGQTTREAALAELERPPLTPTMLEDDMEYVLGKLGLTAGEFEDLMSLPVKSHRDYPTALPLFYARDILGRLGIGNLLRKLRVLPS